MACKRLVSRVLVANIDTRWNAEGTLGNISPGAYRRQSGPSSWLADPEQSFYRAPVAHGLARPRGETARFTLDLRPRRLRQMRQLTEIERSSRSACGPGPPQTNRRVRRVVRRVGWLRALAVAVDEHPCGRRRPVCSNRLAPAIVVLLIVGEHRVKYRRRRARGRPVSRRTRRRDPSPAVEPH